MNLPVILVFGILFKNRAQFDEKSTVSFALLFKPFKSTTFYWQCWILLRRVAMACTSAFLLNVKSSRA